MVHLKIQLNCEKCDYVTNVTSNMRSHVNKKHKYNVKEKFPCKICEREYLGKGALQAHERNAHSSEQELQLFCDICTKTFGNTLSLENHVQSIHKEMKVSCDQCERIFSLKSSLYTHKKSTHE